MLIVDDDPAIGAFVFDLLTEEGYAVVVVAPGQDALAYLQQAAPLPCLILLDLHMPIMNACDFRAVQLLDPALASIPVVLYSTAPNLELMAKELARGRTPQDRRYRENPDGGVASIAHQMRLLLSERDLERETSPRRAAAVSAAQRE